MSLYHEAADILSSAREDNGSLKAIVFGKKTWKSNAKTLYALTTEATKWSDVLSEVIEKSGLLGFEKNLSPPLALLVTHDLLLSKRGIALPSTHGLHSTVSKHKARLTAELTKARLRRGFPSLDALRAQIDAGVVEGQDATSKGEQQLKHPRWIRINTLKTTLNDEINACFTNYTQAQTLEGITHASSAQRIYHVDKHVPNLIATVGPDDPTTFKSYKQGKLILQEKASCFPAYLLNPPADGGDVIDACAAPGNKTTHLAAILSSGGKTIACEKDPERSKTLERMVKLAGADKIVTVKQKQNFLKLDPNAKELANVTSLLLDPSCSGSGIVGRDEPTLIIHLPSVNTTEAVPRGKKRKQTDQQPRQEARQPTTADPTSEEIPDRDTDDAVKLKTRLENLSSFQLRLLEHAMSFPAATKITYSTCSLHAEENEHVVVKALLSDVAREQGWRILRQQDQVEGMRSWHRRGDEGAVKALLREGEAAEMLARGKGGLRLGTSDELSRHVAAACIRCEKGGEDGTMGFFVAGFVRDDPTASNGDRREAGAGVDASADTSEEWNGFSEDEG